MMTKLKKLDHGRIGTNESGKKIKCLLQGVYVSELNSYVQIKFLPSLNELANPAFNEKKGILQFRLEDFYGDTFL